MGRKVFLSVLGTGFYNKCNYVDEQKQFKSVPTRFVQEATLDALEVEKWSERDVVYIFTTDKAFQENWDKSLKTRVRRRGTNEDVQEYIRLEKILEEKHYAASVESVPIPEGLSTEEMWNVFEIMFDKLEDGDRLYIDLTHGFRYLPMMILVLCQYASFMKRTSICSLTYGNFEALDSQLNEAPLMDLSPLSMLQGLTMGAADFQKFGKMGTLSDLFMQSSSGKAKRKFLQVLKDETNALDECLATCRGKELQQGDHAMKIQETLLKLESMDFSPAMKNLFAKMLSQINGFGENGAQNLKAAVEWCIQYGMTQQGYTLCQESLFTLLCEHFKSYNPFASSNMKEDDKVKAFRGYISSILGISQKDSMDESKWKGSLCIFKPLTKFLLNDENIEKLRGAYAPLAACRNQINHAGFIKPTDSKILRSNLKTNARNCMNIVCSLPVCEQMEFCRKDKTPLLLNLSNHPYAVWSEKQRDAARIYGPCEDMEFPKVSADLSSEDLDRWVNDYKQSILKYTNNYIVTVHVMGEMTFCFRLVSQLQAMGIKCIASCAERNVVELGNERIKSTYNFTKFREYGA